MKRETRRFRNRTRSLRAVSVPALGVALFVGPGLVGLLLAGCGGGGGAEGPPRIDFGTAVCAACGMTVRDPHYAAAAREGGATQVYDSIECLARARRQTGGTVSDAIWLPDFQTGDLHPQSHMTVVLADFPSPMGGGVAVFTDSVRARAEAEARGGVAGPLADLVSGSLRRSETP